MSSSSWSVPASDFENHGGEVSRRRDAQTHRGADRASRTGRGADRGRGRCGRRGGGSGGGVAGKRAVSRARRTVVHHRDTLARTRVLLAARAGVPVARSDARRKKDSKRGNGYVVRVAAVARVFSDSSSRSRRARSSRRASPRHRRPSARAAPSPPPIGAIPRALAHAAGARRRAEATPVPRSPALSRSSRRAWLWCFLSRPPRPRARAARRVPRRHPPRRERRDRRGDRIVAVARRRRARHGRRARSRPLPRF